MTDALPHTPSFRLGGKRALVTGASSGIGLGCAVAVAEAGAHVVLAARQIKALESLALTFNAAGWSAEPMAIDINDVSSSEDRIATHGPFDILVNSAGLARHTPALETAEEDYDAVMATNLKGAYFLSRAVAKALITTRRPGSLINISSQMGRVGGPERAVYCATKHGLEGMTKSMAIEWAPHGIRVNTLCPTFINTPLATATLKDPEKRKWIERKIKLGRLGDIDDIMGPVVFLASEASKFITGTALLVDGGWTAD